MLIYKRFNNGCKVRFSNYSFRWYLPVKDYTRIESFDGNRWFGYWSKKGFWMYSNPESASLVWFNGIRGYCIEGEKITPKEFWKRYRNVNN